MKHSGINVTKLAKNLHTENYKTCWKIFFKDLFIYVRERKKENGKRDRERGRERMSGRLQAEGRALHRLYPTTLRS